MIRRATLHDAASIHALERSGADRPWRVESITEHLALGTTRGWVAEDTEVLAHILTSHVLDEAEVLTIVVSPQHRRQGHGADLLRAAIAYWRRTSVSRAHLEVREDNIAARALYESLGWQPTGRRPRYYGPDMDAVLYGWTP